MTTNMKKIWIKLVSLKNPTLNNMLWNVFWMMRGLTVNIDSHSNFRAGLVHYAIAIICSTSYFFYYQCGMVYNIGWIYPETKDVLITSIIISLTFSSQISTVKIVSVAIFRNKLKDLIDKYRAFDETLIPESRYTIAVSRTLKIVKRRALLFWTIFCSTSAVYILTPAFLPGHNLPENGMETIGLRPNSETPNYEISYTLCILASIFATAGIANVTVLLIILAGYIEAHLLALCDELDCLWPDTLQHIANIEPDTFDSVYQEYIATEKQVNKFVGEMLGENIHKHMKLLELHRTVKDIFNEVIGLEFIFTTIAMCAMLLGGLEDTFLQIPFTISQLVVDTILGQRLIDASFAFEQSVYRCGWENYNVGNMKTVQILLQCSQKTLTLTAGNVTYLSYICFTTIVRFVYSANATLRQAMNKVK